MIYSCLATDNRNKLHNIQYTESCVPLLQNPFGQQRGASQGSETEGRNCSDGTTRYEKFQRSGRSHSAPGSYDLLMDRLVTLVSPD